MTEDDIASYLEVDKLVYQRVEDLAEAVTRRGDHHIDEPCMACMNGCYVTTDVTEAVIKSFECRRQKDREVAS